MVSISEQLKHGATYLLHDTKVAAGTAVGTTATGLITQWLDFIPDNVGKLAALIGICLSIVLIWTHISRGRREDKESELRRKKLELEIARLKVSEREPRGGGDEVGPSPEPRTI